MGTKIKENKLSVLDKMINILGVSSKENVDGLIILAMTRMVKEHVNNLKTEKEAARRSRKAVRSPTENPDKMDKKINVFKIRLKLIILWSFFS